jgi:NADH:ubiquinone oxidoreductase subunit E
VREAALVHDLSLYLLELLENATRAGARVVHTTVALRPRDDELRLVVEDDGRGLSVSPGEALDPFFTTKKGKKTGLGLSLFRAEAEATGGSLTVDDSPALGGVRVTVVLGAHHVDRPPVGDIATTVAVTAVTNPQAAFLVTVLDPDRGVDLHAADSMEAADALRDLAAGLDGAAVLPLEAAHDGDGGGAGTTTVNTVAGPAAGPELNTAEVPQKESGMAKEPEDRPDGCGCGCGCGEEPSEEELLARLDEVIANYKEKPGALIPVLQIAQGIFGYLPEVALKQIARGMGKPYSEVAGVVGFYSFFSTVPRGRNIIRVCLGTACYVRGGLAVLEGLSKELGIEVGGTTEDREFSLEVARCFGACGLAPVITINDVVHHRVKPARIGEVLAQYAPEAVGAAERSE